MKKEIYNQSIHPLGNTYDASKGVQGEGDLGDVATLEEIGGLEDLLLGHTVLLDRCLETLDVLHQLEVGAALLDLLHRSGGQFVGQLAQPDAVLENVLVLPAGDLLANHGEHPVEHFLFLFLVAWLRRKMGN